MTQEDKQLLLIDICARLPHGLKFRFELSYGSYITIDLWRDTLINFDQEYCFWILRGDIIPYLRPMSSMTDEEKREYNKLLDNCKEQDQADYNITTLVDSMLYFVID